MRDLTILITAVGCPGASTCIRYLKSISERRIKVVGVDMDKEAVGRFFCDSFLQVPASHTADFVNCLVDFVKKESVDCLIPSSSFDVEPVSNNLDKFDTTVLVSDIDVLRIANNKAKFYNILKTNSSIDLPEYRIVKSLSDFLEAYDILHGKGKNVCFKPVASKGSRGFRYLDTDVNKADILLNYKPESKLMSVDEFIDIFKEEENFPELMVMEKLEGEEIDSMVIGLDGEALLITYKTREAERSGTIIKGEQVKRSEIDEIIKKIVAILPLKYNFSIQFIGNKPIEINPRLSTFIYSNEWNELYFAIKLALGEFSKEDIRSLQMNVPIGTRMIRYFDQIFFEVLHE